MSKNDDHSVLMPGEVYDIIRHHNDISLNKAKHLIQKSKVKIIESSGNVFHQCLKPLSDHKARLILQQSYVRTNKENLKLTYLSKLTNEGVYKSSSDQFYGSISQRLNEPASKIPDTLVELEYFYESIIQDLSNGQTTGLQGITLVNPPTALVTLPYHTSPKLNPRLEVKHGINIPIIRLGTRNSFEQIQKTLGLLDRVDVLHWGACRLWLVVQLNFEAALEIRLANQLTRRGGYPPWCPMPTYHKEFMITPSLLRKWSIPFEIIVQKPGDMVHLRDWVPHQIIDLGTNISETVCVGSVQWNMWAVDSAFLNCPCGTKHNVGNNNFGGNTTIYARKELEVPRSKPMPCTHFDQAVKDAMSEYINNNNRLFIIFDHNLSKNYNMIPVLKEYRKPENPTFRTKGGCKCYVCGKRSDNLKAHLSRNAMCQMKLDLRGEQSKIEEPVTDESDDESIYCSNNTVSKDVSELINDNNADVDPAKYRCAYCTIPFDEEIDVIKHVVQTHKQNILKRNAEDVGPVVKKRRKKLVMMKNQRN